MDSVVIFAKCSLLNLHLLPAPEGHSSPADQVCWVLLEDNGDKTTVFFFYILLIIVAQNNEEKGR